MNADDALSILGVERPVGWLQYEDGSWAAVFEDGTVSAPFSAAVLELVCAISDAMVVDRVGHCGKRRGAG